LHVVGDLFESVPNILLRGSALMLSYGFAVIRVCYNVHFRTFRHARVL